MKKWIALGAVVVLLGAGAFWWAGEATPRPVVRLPDGSQIGLDRVSFGKTHRYIFGTPWQRLIWMLPDKLAAKLAGNVSGQTFSTAEPSLALWFHWRNRSPNGYTEFVLADDSGFESSATANSYSFGTGIDLIEGRSFTAFPRRAKYVTVNVYRRDASWLPHRVAQFKFKNPVSGPFAQWTPEARPMQKKAGDLDVALTRLVTGVKNDRVLKAATNGFTDAWTQAIFRMSRQGQTITNWAPVRIEMTDATGNTAVNSTWSNWTENDRQVMCYRWSLWPNEPAWKVRIELSRTSGFQSNELWTIQNFPVPPAGGYIETNLQRTIGGFTVRVRGLTADGVTLPGSYNSFGGSPSLHFEIISPLKTNRFTLVSVKDDLGHEVPQGGSSLSATEFAYGLRIPAEAKTITFTVALHASRFADFLVKPERLK